MPDLWNSGVRPEDYVGTGEKYRGAILEQYKLCIEMADRASARRGITNTFFLALNTALVAFAGAVWGKTQGPHEWIVVFALAAAIAECVVWERIVHSYAVLSNAKFEVVMELESRLPAAAFGHEWDRLEHANYRQLSHVERLVPLVFAAAYLAAAIFTLAD
jgi:hypothetical protein